MGSLQLVRGEEEIEVRRSPKEIGRDARSKEKKTGVPDRKGNEEKRIRLEERNKTRMKEVQREQRHLKRFAVRLVRVRKTEERRWGKIQKEVSVATKKAEKKHVDKEGLKEREIIRFLSPLYGSGQELSFQSNQAEAKVNNQS